MFGRITLACCLALFCSSSQAQTDPAKSWKSLSTEHFDIFYAAEDEGTAWRYGVYAEESYQLLKPYFSQLPSRTVVVIDDGFDLANGSATRIPYPKIQVYPVLPAPLTSISEYGSWGRELMIHEFTHIASFEAARGAVKPLRWIFGTVVTPNMLLPRWWLEGVAVQMETELSSHGRLRSNYQEALIRALVLDDQLTDISLSEINEVSLPSWPGGARPYLFGSLMWSQLVGEFGKEIIDQLHQSYGGRFPYLLDGPLEDYTGLDYSALHQKTLLEIGEQAQAQIQQIGVATELSSLSFIKDLRKESRNYQFQKAEISPDGLKMVVIGQKNFGDFRLLHLTRESEKEEFTLHSTKKLDEPESDVKTLGNTPTGLSINRVSWLPDSSGYVFDKVRGINRFNYYSDLFIYNWKKRNIKALTQGLRAREPGVSRDGKQLVFVQADADQTSLALFNLETEKSETIYSPAAEVRVSSPGFLQDDSLVFAQRGLDGREQIYRFDLNEKRAELFVEGHEQALFPTITPEGLFFSSSINGISNIYLLPEGDTEPKALTNSNTGFFTLTHDPLTRDLYITEMASQGFNVGKLQPQKRWQAQVESNTERVLPLSLQEYPDPPDLADVPVSTSNWQTEDYSPGGYLLPHYWLPFLFQDEYGAWGLSVATGGSDPLERHNYSVSLAMDPQTNYLDHGVSYVNASFETLIHLDWIRQHDPVIGTGGVIQSELASILFDHEYTFWDREFFVGMGWEYLEQAPIGESSVRTGPQLIFSVNELSQDSGEVAPHSGWITRLGHTYYIPDAGDLSYHRTDALAGIYTSALLPERHSLGFQVMGTFVDQEIPASFGTISQGVDVSLGRIHNRLIMRGYLSGQFWGTRFVNAHLEYAFPVAEIYKGRGVLPLFLKQIHSTIVLDGLAMDGLAYSPETERYSALDMDEVITGVGIELNLDGTVGYSFPASAVFGLYYGLNESYSSDTKVFLGLQL